MRGAVMKRKILTIIIAVICVACIGVISACGGAKGITLDRSEVTLFVGDTMGLAATVDGADDEDKTVNWSSSDEKIAIVKNGIVKGVAVGEATITATTSDGKKSATCKVTVKEGTIYERLNAYKANTPTLGRVSVTTTIGEATLNNTYTITKVGEGYKVEYHEEKLNTFAKDDGNYSVSSDSYKTEIGGTTEYNAEGNVTSGEEISFKMLTLTKFDFAEENFEGVTDENNQFKATVTNMQAFCGTEGATNATVIVSYDMGEISALQLSYTSGEANVTILFEA